MEQERSNNEQTRQLQQCLLGTLKAIDQMCRQHGLTYYLLAGSCLGAMRHKGFIPWDDDADVGLPRPDYDRLVAHASEWLPADYELTTSADDDDYPYPFARIHDRRTTYILRRHFRFVSGVPVDVYPLDVMVGPGLRRRWHYLRYHLATKLLYFSMVDPDKHGRGLWRLFVLAMHRLFPAKRMHRWQESIQQEFRQLPTGLLADHDYKPGKGILPEEVYGKPSEVEFEDTRLMTVSQPDRYLTHLYGDWHQLPKSLPPQNFRGLDLHKPYREFIAEGGQTS